MGKKSSHRPKPSKKPSRKPAHSAKRPAASAKHAPAKHAPKKAAAKPAPAAAMQQKPVATPAMPASPPMPPLPAGPSGVRKRFELDKLRLASVRERRPSVRIEQFARIVPPVCRQRLDIGRLCQNDLGPLDHFPAEIGQGVQAFAPADKDLKPKLVFNLRQLLGQARLGRVRLLSGQRNIQTGVDDSQ